jgi:uncharacterized protein (DUF1697 family)
MRYVALLRGINVGGHKRISMADLRELLSSLEYTDVVTYILSGNALFTSPRKDPAKLAREIERRIVADLGHAVKVLIRTPEELAKIVAGNPFSDAETKPPRVYVSFLAEPADAERLSKIDPRMFEPEEFRVGDRVVYLRFPEGYQGAKLTNDFWERRLGLDATTRNWNTVTKLLSMATD